MEQRGHPTRRGRAHALRRADVIEVAGIPRLESQLEIDRGELVKVKAEQTKPNIDAASLAAGRAAFRAKYEQVQQAKAQEAQRQEAQRQAEMRERAAQRLAAERERERKQQEQEQKQVRQAKRDRGGPDLGR